MFFSLWDKRIKIKQDTARRTKLIKLNTFNFIIRNSKNKSEIIKPQANKLIETKMNAINKQFICLTRLIAEIVELDSDKQCLSVELDYLIQHLQMYKQTCEDAKHREEFPDHRICECDCCIDCGCCECGEHSEDEKEEEEPEEKHCECFNCEGWHQDYPEEGTVKVCEDASCGKEFSIYDPHYYDDHQCLCYCSKACYKNDENESDDEEPEEESDEEEETPTCGFCGKDAGQSPIEHPKWDELYFCCEKCYNDYE
jgi:hypothetical protein